MDEMNRYFWAGWVLGQFDSMTQGELLELRVRRMVEWRIWFEAVIGRAWLPMLEKRHRLRWPDAPEAEKERFCEDWRCRKKVPAGRLVCPWCGSWNGEWEWRMQPLEFPAASIEVQLPQSRVKELLKEILGDS